MSDRTELALRDKEYLLNEIERLQAENDVLHKTDKWRYENVLLMKSEIERLTAECEEQARLNGMGAERELALRAEVDRLRAEGRRFVDICEEGFRRGRAIDFIDRADWERIRRALEGK